MPPRLIYPFGGGLNREVQTAKKGNSRRDFLQFDPAISGNPMTRLTRGDRWWRAPFKALRTRDRSRVLWIDQPTTRREYRSSTTARYSHPSPVHRYVMSADQSVGYRRSPGSPDGRLGYRSEGSAPAGRTGSADGASRRSSRSGRSAAPGTAQKRRTALPAVG